MTKVDIAEMETLKKMLLYGANIAREISNFNQSQNKSEFLHNPTLEENLRYNVFFIGTLANQLSEECKANIQENASQKEEWEKDGWQTIEAARKSIEEEFPNVDDDLVMNAAFGAVPALLTSAHTYYMYLAQRAAGEQEDPYTFKNPYAP